MSSLGMLETEGRIALISACDAMSKAADVEFLSTAKTGAGRTTVFIRGSVSSCQAACEAGAIEAARCGKVVAVNVIPSPHPQLKSHWGEVIERRNSLLGYKNSEKNE